MQNSEYTTFWYLQLLCYLKENLKDEICNIKEFRENKIVYEGNDANSQILYLTG